MESLNYNFDLNLYHVFYVVAQTKSISKAAELLFVSQPAVSYSIKTLEDALGGSLFFRTPKGVELTPEAEKLYDAVKSSYRSLAMGEKLFKEDKELMTGDLYIGCNPSLFQVGLYPYIATYHKQYPGIKIHIVSKPATDLIKMLENHELDMVIRKFGMETTFRNFSVKIASQITHCFFCNKNYKQLASKKDVSLEELSQYPLLVLNQTSYERRALDQDFKKQNVKLEPIMDFTYHAPIVYLVKLGYGIGYTLKEAIQEELNAKELYQIKVSQISSMHNLGIVYHEKYLSSAANKLIEMI